MLLVQRRRRKASFDVAAEGTQESLALQEARAQRELQRLRRRFVQSKQGARSDVAFHARRAMRKKADDARRAEERKQARFAQVQLYRNYRDGEVSAKGPVAAMGGNGAERGRWRGTRQ